MQGKDDWETLITTVFFHQGHGLSQIGPYTKVTEKWPKPEDLSQAKPADVGKWAPDPRFLQTRAVRVARGWVKGPPRPTRRTLVVGYPSREVWANRQSLKPTYKTMVDEGHQAWQLGSEVAHLVGIGEFSACAWGF